MKIWKQSSGRTNGSVDHSIILSTSTTGRKMKTIHTNYKMVRKSLLSRQKLKLKTIWLRSFKTYGTTEERRALTDFSPSKTLGAILENLFWQDTLSISLSLPQAWIKRRMISSFNTITLKVKLGQFVNGMTGKNMRTGGADWSSTSKQVQISTLNPILNNICMTQTMFRTSWLPKFMRLSSKMDLGIKNQCMVEFL